MEFIESHADDFRHFMEEDETWDDYVPRMKNEREWGGQHEIVAASRLFKVRQGLDSCGCQLADLA